MEAVYEAEVLLSHFLSNIFVIPKHPTGSRLILYVSRLNEYLEVPSFRMTNHSTLRKCLLTPA